MFSLNSRFSFSTWNINLIHKFHKEFSRFSLFFPLFLLYFSLVVAFFLSSCIRWIFIFFPSCPSDFGDLFSHTLHFIASLDSSISLLYVYTGLHVLSRYPSRSHPVFCNASTCLPFQYENFMKLLYTFSICFGRKMDLSSSPVKLSYRKGVAEQKVRYLVIIFG